MDPLPSNIASQPAPRRRRTKKRGWSRMLVIGLPVLLAGLVALLFGARLWIDQFLRGEEFRLFMNRKATAALRADARFDPFHWQGGEVYSAALDAAGQPENPLSRLAAEQIRADLNLRALWQGVWRVDTLDVERFKADFSSSTAAHPPTAATVLPNEAPSDTNPAHGLASFLPTRVEIGTACVADCTLTWNAEQPGAGGRLEHARLTAQPLPDGRGWEIAGQGGRVEQAHLPAVKLERFAAKTGAHDLFITEANGQVETGGQIQFSGLQELDGERSLALDVQFDGLNAGDFLPEDWRGRLHGQAVGNVHISGSGASPAGWRATGHVSLRDGRLEALPFLNELAIFTATVQYRQTALQKGVADFEWTPSRLIVRNLLVESEGLLRLEGGFTVQGDQIDGRLQVGVARTAVRWLAGVGGRVFNQPERDGYVWTTMQLSGPARSPREDLTTRLTAATRQEVIDKANQGAGAVIDTAKGLLNLIPVP